MPPVRQELTPREREELRTFFSGDAWRKTIALARQHAPSPFIPELGHQKVKIRKFAAVAQLFRIQGWKMFEAALVKETKSPEERRPAIRDDYPDAGRIDPASALKTTP